MIMCHNVLNVWPKTTPLLPVCLRDPKRLDTPVRALAFAPFSPFVWCICTYIPMVSSYPFCCLQTGMWLCVLCRLMVQS